MRGEWIEIDMSASDDPYRITSLPVRGEWIEIYNMNYNEADFMSLPVRGEWIEIGSLRSLSECCFWSLPVRGEWIEI